STVSLKIDRTSPTTNISVSGTPGNAGWYTSNVLITLSAVDVTSGVNFTEYSLDGETWNLYSTSFTISDEGQSSIYFRSQDIAGDYELSKTLLIFIDKSAPITLVSIGGFLVFEDWYQSNALISLFADDNYNVSHTEYSFDGINWVSYGEPFNMEGLNLYYYSTDLAGNIEATNSVTIKTVKFPFIIDELDPNNPSWEDVVDMGLCTGSGTLSDPYIIENWIFPESVLLIPKNNSNPLKLLIVAVFPERVLLSL
ncbi:unnamed protein product, partial [marine sediment metagenome]